MFNIDMFDPETYIMLMARNILATIPEKITDRDI